jgi:VWFA-related protein
MRLMRSARAITLLVVAGFATPSWSAQGQSADEPRSGVTVLHTTTNLVLVDVVVTGKGKAIHNLERSRFHVFEDGREQSITSFDEHDFAPTPAPVPRPAMIPISLPANTYSNFSAEQALSAANVLLLDELNTPQQNREVLRQQMIEYLATVRPGTLMSVFVLTSELRMVQGFTGDAAQAIAALKGMKAEQFGAHLTDSSKNPTADFDNHVPFRHNDPLTDNRPQITLQVVQELARYLSLIPGRKNLIWFAGNFPVAFDPGASLSAAQVAVYPVDARGMMSLPGSRVSYLHDKDDQAGELENEDFRERSKAERGAMEQFAEQTGGQAYFNTNGLKEAAASAVENGSSYYTIGYVPPEKKADGKLRNIKVRVDGGGYELAYRRGYYAAPKPSSSENAQPPSQMTESVVHGAPAATQILFQARVLPASDPALRGTNVPAGPAGDMAASLKDPVQHTIVDVTLDPHSLALKDGPEGARQAQVEFALVAYDAHGKRLNYLLHALQVNIKADLYAQVVNDGIPVRLALDLPAGQCFLRIAVYDLDAGKAGSLEVPVTVAAGERPDADTSRSAEPPLSGLQVSGGQSHLTQSPAALTPASQLPVHNGPTASAPDPAPGSPAAPLPGPTSLIAHPYQPEIATSYFALPVERLKSVVSGLRGIQYDPDQEKLPVILAGVANRIADVLPRLPDLSSREDVYSPNGSLNDSVLPAASIGQPSNREFRYLLHCQRNSDGSTIITESRTDSRGKLIQEDLFSGVSGYGFAYQWLFFSVANQRQFRFRYLGRQEKNGRDTFVVVFVQDPRKVEVPAYFMADGRKAPFYYQGILWVDQSSFDVVALRTDLLDPLQNMLLTRLTTQLTFRSVPIRGYHAVFWLPSEVDISSERGAGPVEENHRYSDYHLFHAQVRIVASP